MTKRLLAAICLLFSSAVHGEILLNEIYLAADGGSLSTPGFFGPSRNGIAFDNEAGRIALSFRESVQGWGTEFAYLNAPGGGGCGCGNTLTEKELGSVEAIQLYETYSYRLFGRLSLFGKLGIVHAKYEAGVAPGVIANNSGFGLGAGVGAQLDLFRKVGVRVQYEGFGTDSHNGGPNRMRYFGVGLVLRFR